jgi:hypothetical protein
VSSTEDGDEGAHSHTPTDGPPDDGDPPIDYEQAVKDITRPTVKLASYARRSRRLIWAALAAILIAFAGVAFSIYAIGHVNQVAHQARVDQCHTGNSFRAGDLALWTEVFKISTAPQTAQQAANVATFKVFLNHHDAPLDCTHIP